MCESDDEYYPVDAHLTAMELLCQVHTLLNLIENPEYSVQEIAIEPEFVARNSHRRGRVRHAFLI
jgi:hypothetical protein